MMSYQCENIIHVELVTDSFFLRAALTEDIVYPASHAW